MLKSAGLLIVRKKIVRLPVVTLQREWDDDIRGSKNTSRATCQMRKYSCLTGPLSTQ